MTTPGLPPVAVATSSTVVHQQKTLQVVDGDAASTTSTGVSSIKERISEDHNVAPRTTEAKFHSYFQDDGLEEDDVLIEDYSCAFQGDILIQGRLFVSELNVSFRASILGWEKTFVLPWKEIKTIEKAMTAKIIANAIEITTNERTYFFASFLGRDSAYDLLIAVWAHHNPSASADALSKAESSSISFKDDAGISQKFKFQVAKVLHRDTGSDANGSGARGGRTDAEKVRDAARASDAPTGDGHPPTEYDGEEFKNVAIDIVLPTSPELAYELMFKDKEFLTNFLVETEKVKELNLGDWSEGEQPTRDFNYIKPLHASMGPKETLCNIEDINEKSDPESYYTTVTTTHTPNVPSGDNFSVKTRTVITWSDGGAAHVKVTTEVAWTKVNPFLRGVIERSCLEGQVTYHKDLETAAREKISGDAAKYKVEGAADDEKSPAAAESASAPTSGGSSLLDSLPSPLIMVSVLVGLLLITNFWTLIALRHQAQAAYAAKVGSPAEVASSVQRVLVDFGKMHAKEGLKERGLRTELDELRVMAKGLEKGVHELVDRLAAL